MESQSRNLENEIEEEIQNKNSGLNNMNIQEINDVKDELNGKYEDDIKRLTQKGKIIDDKKLGANTLYEASRETDGERGWQTEITINQINNIRKKYENTLLSIINDDYVIEIMHPVEKFVYSVKKIVNKKSAKTYISQLKKEKTDILKDMLSCKKNVIQKGIKEYTTLIKIGENQLEKILEKKMGAENAWFNSHIIASKAYSEAEDLKEKYKEIEEDEKKANIIQDRILMQTIHRKKFELNRELNKYQETLLACKRKINKYHQIKKLKSIKSRVVDIKIKHYSMMKNDLEGTKDMLEIAQERGSISNETFTLYERNRLEKINMETKQTIEKLLEAGELEDKIANEIEKIGVYPINIEYNLELPRNNKDVFDNINQTYKEIQEMVKKEKEFGLF